ncbi:hypothetical protein NCS57_00950700 [Fusarium keratoplasticum]|uniref:Uncharacterized protein n=1 Tax=Fusarium keratoplasticum TaxID=1328300 RepID=A0ACC0QQN8_9HYPO|nr:hypothetical protein NCS57_00950700 [Fusarium keratoplasticum]KAI8663495.1 hypothetical protein NCS57_00950700 [Fusarium keratoplasticum]
MVASTPEYHILGKRVPVNRLRLGTIIPSIQVLTRLNPGKEPTIDGKRLDYWHDTVFKATRDDALKGEAGVELKVAALEGVGGEGKVDGERGNIDKYSFSAIDTLEFESVQKDYNDAGQAEGVQTFLKKSKYRPVFYITGIKVGRVPTDEDSGPTFEATRVKKLGGTLSLGVNIPSLASIGPKTSGSKNLTITQQYREHNDRIFAIRVRKLQYKKTGFFGPREWVDEPANDGAEMVGEDREEQEEEKPELAFDEVEEVGLEEKELKGYEKITETNRSGQQVTYVVPKGW